MCQFKDEILENPEYECACACKQRDMFKHIERTWNRGMATMFHIQEGKHAQSFMTAVSVRYGSI